MPFCNRTYRVEDGKFIPGIYLQAFIKNGDYYVAEIGVYKDGRVDCWGLVSLEEFKKRVAEGWIRTRLQRGAHVHCMVSNLAFTVDEAFGGVAEESFVGEVLDIVERLNDRPTSLDRCRSSLDRYKEAPSSATLDDLRDSYQAVPSHLRRCLGGMDFRDWEFREILGLQ